MNSDNALDLINEYRHSIELGNAVDAIQYLPAFNLLINENLFNKRVQSLVFKLSITQNQEDIDNIHKELYAISYFKNYLLNTQNEGTDALLHLNEAQQTFNNYDEE